MSTISAIRLATRLAASRFTSSMEPRKLILETTRRCNSHCRTCDMWRQSPGPELHPDDLLRAVATVARSICWAAITGGEVTLYPYLAYLVRGLVSRCPNLTLINIPLNGINPDRTSNLIEQLLGENKSILFHTTLSIDGIGQDQDDLRGRGQWNQTMETWGRLQTLRKRHKNLRVSAQMTVSRLNIGKSLQVMKRFAKESDTFIVAFGMENRFYGMDASASGPGGRAGLDGRELVTIDTKSEGTPRFELQKSDVEAVRAIVRQYRVSGLGGFLEKLFLLGMLRRLRRGSAGVRCVAGDQVVFISAKGEVKPCPFFEQSMGHLEDSDYDLHALLKGPGANDVRAAARTCEKCWNNCVGLPSLVASPVRALRLLGER
jgi:MoaA/NifB/PqqE/SkfB family radical SAM enzyme